jgi:uncharacterized membrane protein (UPF0127 family)
VRRPVLILLCAVAAASCHHNAASQPAGNPAADIAPPVHEADATPHLVLRPAGAPAVTVSVEVQRTPESREHGLMFRRQLDELAGMVFMFPAAEHQVFWMHNTYLPLDMVFITADRHVLGVVKNATPMTDDERQVDGESQYVLEVRAGFADRHHIAAGTTVEFVNVPPAVE